MANEKILDITKSAAANEAAVNNKFEELSSQQTPSGTNPLSGKKLLMFGDSYVAGQTVWPTWHKIFADAHGMTYQHVAIGGVALVGNYIKNYALIDLLETNNTGTSASEIPSAPIRGKEFDCIGVCCGRNDYSSGVKIGSINDYYDKSTDPVLEYPYFGPNFEDVLVGDTVTRNIFVKGKRLTEDLVITWDNTAITVDGSSDNINGVTVSASDANAGVMLPLVYAPLADTSTPTNIGTLTVSSSEVEKQVTLSAKTPTVEALRNSQPTRAWDFGIRYGQWSTYTDHKIFLQGVKFTHQLALSITGTGFSFKVGDGEYVTQSTITAEQVSEGVVVTIRNTNASLVPADGEFKVRRTINQTVDTLFREYLRIPEGKTFKGALNYLCDWLTTNYPTKKIFFVTPWSFLDDMKQAIANPLDYVDAIIEVAGKWGVPCFDAARQSGIMVQSKAFRSQYFMSASDTSHLNVAGHQRMANGPIKSWLENLFRD